MKLELGMGSGGDAAALPAGSEAAPAEDASEAPKEAQP
jgi:hypothetical protein